MNQAFENTSTSVAASQMRNALTALAETCQNPEEKKVRFLSNTLYVAANASFSSSRLRWITFSSSSGGT